jgi:phosphoglycolate phosphatase
MTSRKYSHILWDWNGTLLDDAWLCVEVMNSMLAERDLPLIDLDMYRHIFDFPVKEYYIKLGFDFDREPFEVVGMEFMVLYNQRHHESLLHAEVMSILNHCQSREYKQYILSAREQTELIEEVITLGVYPFFEKIYGLDDHYASGKNHIGKRLLRDIGVSRKKVIFIGDTRHDAEVATELGIQCILIPNGHHHSERFHGYTFPVLSSISDLISFI